MRNKFYGKGKLTSKQLDIRIQKRKDQLKLTMSVQSLNIIKRKQNKKHLKKQKEIRLKYSFSPEATKEYKRKFQETKALDDIFESERIKERQVEDYVYQHMRKSKGQLRSSPLCSPEKRTSSKLQFKRKQKVWMKECKQMREKEAGIEKIGNIIGKFKTKGKKNCCVRNTDKLIYLSKVT